MGGSSLRAASSISKAPIVFPVSSSLIEFVAGGYLARDVDHDRVAFPVLHQLLLAQMAQEGFLHQFNALVFHQLRVGFELPVQHHAHLPRTGEHVRIFDRHVVAQRVGGDRRKALDDVQRVAVEVAGP